MNCPEQAINDEALDLNVTTRRWSGPAGEFGIGQLGSWSARNCSISSMSLRLSWPTRRSERTLFA
jgi:hypothetical protein